ncbi:1-acyl-sn-glycerol-3-phosphate acyltransferase [Vibrio sp. SCSIO 43136]|uniref:1-acyl-sn-glycerol-3-phosphate acyltransferase n=1 Tax=Vibrio sp. SCSIO 43136 TaxID=2819101 RepID=UPI0020764E9F|nr:1-acyl-sn-glycerol-3-phosphate acyltransferase [Vibrio sp. SCSIO 43136]USD68078.1 1-acyl-sn-glycerol-3-phosphate acyltransferase [Vibrio sp. SCSIO 43136]
MTDNNDIYHDIRPYNDSEIPGAIERLINDEEFIDAILSHRFHNRAGWFKALVGPIVKVYLKFKWAKFTTVESIQREIEKYLAKLVKQTTDGVTFTGLENLDKNSTYLFVSNHRDIAMDPALVNWGLHNAGHKTSRIAIGDNLLKKACATELMRINKSFIVKRGAKGPREMMKALAQLSGYIKHSLEDGHSIWIAQKEGRAKDGNDQTDPAILKMFHVEGRKQKVPFAEYIRSLKIVPVSISYENDPCDIAKAKELFEKQSSGTYEKGEFEDIESIIQGIIGYKGRVHVAFGDVIDQDFETPEALATELDRQIHDNYKIYPINQYAAGLKVEEESASNTLKQKLTELPEGAHSFLTEMYANPVRNKA